MTPFLESLGFFMSNATLVWTKKCHLGVKILSQSCSFWCTQKNAKNRHLEFSNHKISIFPPSSKILAMILRVYNFFKFLQGCHAVFGLFWNKNKTKQEKKNKIPFCWIIYTNLKSTVKKFWFCSKKGCQGCHISKLGPGIFARCTSN